MIASSPRPFFLLFVIGVLLPGSPRAATADTDWSACPILPATADAASNEATAANPALPPGTLDIHADAARLIEEGVSELSGNVTLQKNRRHLQADKIYYNQTDNSARIPVPLEYEDNELNITSESAQVQLDSDKGRFSDAEFTLKKDHARGKAGLLLRTGKDETRLKDVFYTTCPPGDTDWHLSASQLRLDHAEGLGYGRNVWVSFMHVPLFYTPWLSFPIDDRRRTGLLPPTIGNSDLSGFEFSLPFYWNIAPNLDDTFTPRWLSERGVQLQNEFRYLFGRDYTSEGSLYTEYLADDDKTGTDRYHFQWRHRSQLPADFRLTANVNGVSDEQYFEDFGDSLSVISRAVTQPRSLSLSRTGPWYTFSTRFLGYQILEPGTEPYFKLPAISFNAEQYYLPGSPGTLKLSLESELVNFQHDEKVSGLRADLLPRAQWQFGSAGWFVTPGVGYRYTEYQLEQTDGTALDLSREAPIYTLDTGLFLERDALGWLTKGGLIQTLEPRLFYLNVPFRQQDAIPRFDTSAPDFTFARLFSTNRFIGPDRLGDANQASLALTSRLLDPATGRELLAASIGRIRFFEPRQVQLTPSMTPDVRDWSGYIAEVRLQPSDKWSFRGSVEWDPEIRQTLRSSYQIQYRPGDYSVYNLGYRLRDGEFEQVDASFAWPVTDRLSLVGRWYYSLSEDRPLAYFGGLEYESCCWVVRLVSRKYIYNRAGDTTDTLFLQLELKGLGAVGRKADEFLENGILGYGPEDYDY